MKLPIPIRHKEKICYELDVKKPTPEVIANAQKSLDVSGNGYHAIAAFCSGCIENVNLESGEVISEKMATKIYTQHLPYKSAEYLAIELLKMVNEDDGIEGVYPCPRCHHQVIAERIYEGEEILSDSLDYLSMLHVEFMSKEHDGLIHHTFEEEIKITDARSKDVLETIRDVTLHYPTLQDCISAFDAIGGKDYLRLQFQIYTNAIEKVNGEKKEKKWTANFGRYLFEKNPSLSDLKELFKKGREFGLDSTVNKTCPKCAKKWSDQVNPMNFFGSALRSIG